jgi:hypothetical protein
MMRGALPERAATTRLRRYRSFAKRQLNRAFELGFYRQALSRLLDSVARRGGGERQLLAHRHEPRRLLSNEARDNVLNVPDISSKLSLAIKNHCQFMLRMEQQWGII